MQPSNSVDTKENHSVANDEIDLLDLIRSAFRTWKQLFIALVVVSVIFGSLKAIEILRSTQETTFTKPIRLTFPNAQKLVFPSGAKFAYSDIVAPAVAEAVFEKNNLAQYGLSVSDLQGGLSAMPYSPSYPFIVERYNRKLTDKKLSPDNIAQLQKELEKEIEQITTGEAVITLRLREKKLPKAVATKVLNDVPVVWADRAINEKGVLLVNAQLATVNSLNSELIQKEEALISGDLINQKIKLLKANISQLADFEGAQSITDPKTGMRLTDLNNAIDDLNQYVIGNLFSPIRLLGLSSTPKMSAFYFEDRINKLKIKLSSLQKQADAIKDSNSPYLQYERTNRSLLSDSGLTQSNAPQFTVDMLDRLAGLSSEAEKEKYKQKINNDWIQLTKDISDAESAISEAQRIYNALLKASTQSNVTEENQKYLAEVKNKLPSILETLKSYFEVSSRIHIQLSAESVGMRAQLYRPIIDGVTMQRTIIDIKSTLITWIALMFLTTVIVVPACMIRNALKEKAA